MQQERHGSRDAIASDLEFDPTYRQQRFVARYLIGTLLNHLKGVKPLFEPEISRAELLRQAEALARQYGIIAPPDGLHHAPACPANLWDGTNVPSKPCTCGAWKAAGVKAI